MHRIVITTLAVPALLFAVMASAIAKTQCPNGMFAYPTVRGDTCPKLNKKLNFPKDMDLEKVNKPISGLTCPLLASGGQTICYFYKPKATSIIRHDPYRLTFAPFSKNSSAFTSVIDAEEA